MIYFNTKEVSKARLQQKLLTLEEEKEAIDVLNKYLSTASNEENEAVQKLIYNYENMSNYTHNTCGLWSTDLPEKVIDKEGVLFQLCFGEPEK